jgi:hypothetical protein
LSNEKNTATMAFRKSVKADTIVVWAMFVI